MRKTWKAKKELMEYIQEYYVTGKVTRNDIIEKFNINANTLNSFLYYHKIKVNCTSSKIVCPYCNKEIEV